MKNLVFNLRTAKAQAEGCATVTKSRRMAKVLTTLTLLLTLGVGQMWAGQGYNGESHVYLNVDGTTKYYKVSTESWATGSSLPGTWGGVLKDQTFNKVLNIQIKGGAVGGWTENGGNISGNLYYKVTNNTTTPSSGWTTVGGINANYTTKSGNNCFRYKNDYSVNVTPTTPGTYYLHIKIVDGASTNRTSYVKLTVPSFTVAGSSTVLGSNWSATDTDNDMTFSSGTTYTLTKSNVTLSTGTTYECKVVLNHDWDAGSYPESNKTFTVDANGHYNVTFSFNASSKAVDVSTTRLYAVIYNDNDKTSGSVPATSYHANGATVTVASNSGSLAKTGYSFGGWNTNSSGTGTNYTAGSGTFTMGSSDKNLYAKWTQTVTLHDNNGGNNNGSATATYNKSGNLTPTAPTRAGYTVEGYYAEPECTNKVMSANGSLVNYTGYVSSGKWIHSGATTLYAKWTPIWAFFNAGSRVADFTYVSAYEYTLNITLNSSNASAFHFQKDGSTYYYCGADNPTSMNVTLVTGDGRLNWTNNGNPYGTYTLTVKSDNSGSSWYYRAVQEIRYSVTYDANGGTGTVTDASSPYLSGANVTVLSNSFTRTGYTFSKWNTAPDGSGQNYDPSDVISSISADVTLYAQWTAKQTTVTLDKQSGSGGPATVTATYGQAMPSATMPTRSNYTFQGYYASTGGSGKQYYAANGSSANTWDQESATKTIYAHWAETKYAVTVAVSDPDHAAGNIDCTAAGWEAGKSGTAQIGNLTNVTITVGAAAAGYKFDGGYWTLTGGVTLISGNLTDPSITVKATAAGSATYTYAEDLTSTYYVEGDASGPFTYGWNANANTMMMKRTGYSTSSDVYWELEVPASKTSPGNNQWEFKIYNDASTTNEKWYGWGNGTVHHWLTKANNNLTLSTTGSNTIYLKCYVEGTYTFHVNYSTPASPTLEVIWPVVNQLRISSANPADAGNTGNYDLVEGSDNDWSVSRNLNAGTTYTFKMVYEGDWYGKNSTNLTRASNSASALSTDGANMTIETDVAGSYTFTFNSSSKNLTVTYPTAYTITYGVGTLAGCDAVTTSPSFTSGDYVLPETDVTFSKGSTNSGYTWKGWYSNVGGTGDAWSTSDASLSLTDTRTGNISVYACYNYATYTATLSTTGRTGYGSGAPANQTATYLQAMPTITPPTATNGYCFMGYWDGEEGTGTQYYNANGTSAHAWDKTSGATLYAYFKKAEITDITLNNTMFDPVAAGGTGFVIANPTIEPTPVLPVKICWELLYDNDNPVPAGHEAIDDHDGSHPNRVKFSIAGLAAGGYKIKATLRTGDDCSGGTLLSKREVSFTIASGYTVTIQYKDSEGNTIAPSTTSPGKATDWTSISAPTIVGYNFSTWVPGDGITLESSATTNSNRFKATFNGTLTARYTKKRVIYFNNTLGWSNVYVYFYSSNKYWADNYGTGAYAGKYFDGYKPYSDQRHGHMTQIEGTNIWYFDYTAAGYDTYENIAFANMDKSNSGTDNTSNNNLGFFSNTTSDPIQVVRRGDHNASLPMFVPLAGQPKTKLNNNKAEYSNQGYWMNYPENTGYALRLFNSSGVEIDSIPFEFTPDKTMPMSVEYILDGSKTYQFKLYRTDGKWFGNNGTMKAGASGDIGETSWEFKEKDGETTRNNCRINTNAAGTYTFTLDFGNKDGYNYLIGVHYPAAANDFQILYNDNAEWSLGSTHDENWVHPSRIIRARENGVDTISFFVAKDNAPILKARKVNSINASGAITWGSLNISGAAKQDLTVDSSAVYNFKVTQGAAGVINSIQYIGAYTGNYYIRSSALSNKWGNYVDNLDHRMTYSSFSESNANSFGEKYSHYKAKWCPRNTNIAFCIANDYSPCITDTLKQDVGNPYGNTDINGTLNNDGVAGHSGNNAYLDRYSANVRFMWDRKTNKISRAYISAATSGLAQFLVLRAGQELHNENNVAISSSPANSVLLSDNENWIYEARLMIKPGTRFKLYACYAKNPVDPASAQYFRGAYDSDNFTSDDNSVILIGGESVDYQLARIVYDFKTNRLIAAWMPSGEVSGTNEINADVMIIRDHQESARCITFADASANLSKVKTVYGVMRFNRWILNNRQHPEDQDKEHARPDHIVEDLAEHHPPLSVGQQKSTYERRLYFISFPFDVLVGDIFGFGTYGQYWVIQYYDGLNRAKKGYWMDSKPNWKYVSPTQVAQGYKLEKNQGYILELNLSAMAADNTTFWSNGISTIELYFPSTVNQEILKQTNCTIPALSDEYECKINRGTEEGDRRVKDSYWRCIGVPSYNLYNSTLKDGSGNDITWKTDYTWYNDEREFPFIYMWNKTDNTLTPQSTSAFLFQPMHAYLTQIKSAIVWTAVSAKPSSIVARRASKEATKEYNWRIELKQDTTFLDQTYVRMTDLEQVTDNFDFGQDLIKELNSRSNIYTFIGYEKVAANSMTLHTDQTTVIPVGANITTEGEYTFALPDGADGIGVTLIDAETGTHTNLSAGMDYTVYLEKGTHDNRFWLEISPIQNTPTGMEDPTSDSSLKGRAQKRIIDGVLYIVKDGKIFDARGTRVE